MNEIVGVSFLLKALGYGIPGAILVFGFLALPIMMRFLRNKQDKDRREHMAKWDSMVLLQEKSIQVQKEATEALIETHSAETSRIITNHKEEIARMFNLHERQAAAIEALAHNLTVISKKIEEQHICPNNRRVDDGK